MQQMDSADPSPPYGSPTHPCSQLFPLFTYTFRAPADTFFFFLGLVHFKTGLTRRHPQGQKMGHEARHSLESGPALMTFEITHSTLSSCFRVCFSRGRSRLLATYIGSGESARGQQERGVRFKICVGTANDRRTRTVVPVKSA